MLVKIIKKINYICKSIHTHEVNKIMRMNDHPYIQSALISQNIKH